MDGKLLTLQLKTKRCQKNHRRYFFLIQTKPNVNFLITIFIVSDDRTLKILLIGYTFFFTIVYNNIRGVVLFDREYNIYIHTHYTNLYCNTLEYSLYIYAHIGQFDRFQRETIATADTVARCVLRVGVNPFLTRFGPIETAAAA